MANNITLNPGISGSVVQTIDNTGGATAAHTQAVAIVDSTGVNKVAVSAGGALSVIDVDTDVIGTGSLTALNAAVTLSSLNTVESAGVQITGTWVGTVTFEGSIDGTNFFSIQGTSYTSTGALVTTATANGQWQFDIAGVQAFRVRASAFTSGTIVVTVRGTTGTAMFGLDAPLPPGSNVIGAVTQSGTWNIGSVTTLPALVAGSAIIGKVGIDQTTVGTTNAVSLAQIGATTIVTGGVAGTQAVGGITTVNAASTGNPVYGGGIAVVAANPTAAANGQRTGFATDKIGRLLTVPGHERTMTGVQTTTIATTTETTIVTAGAAGVFNDITQLTITNSSATATLVTLKDATAGTTRAIYSLSAGGCVVISFPTPLAQATAANNWTLTLGTAVTSVYVVAQYVKNN